MKSTVIITKDNIIKVSQIEKGILTGYDIFTEELIQIPDSGYISLTDKVISLLGNEEHRLRLASSICKTQVEITKAMNMSERSVFRLQNKYMNHDTSKRKIHQKTNLTNNDIKEIKDLCKNSELDMIQIAERYSVSKTTIRHIHLGLKSYKSKK